jgi:hypothetical protein
MSNSFPASVLIPEVKQLKEGSMKIPYCFPQYFSGKFSNYFIPVNNPFMVFFTANRI